jgi:hypothetical protein
MYFRLGMLIPFWVLNIIIFRFWPTYYQFIRMHGWPVRPYGSYYWWCYFIFDHINYFFIQTDICFHYLNYMLPNSILRFSLIYFLLWENHTEIPNEKNYNFSHAPKSISSIWIIWPLKSQKKLFQLNLIVLFLLKIVVCVL